MNGRLARKIRKEARKRDVKILPELKQFINDQGIFTRLHIAFRVTLGRF